MEKYIDLINAYLDKTLSKAEVIAFENRLKTDTEFNSIYNEHLIIIGGIERATLTQEISNAKESYVRTKWLKYLSISIGIILISILMYSLITESQNVENQNIYNNDSIEVIVDSTSLQSINDSIKKYVVIEYHIEQVKDEEMTERYGGVEVIKETLVKKEMGLFSKEHFESEFSEIEDFIIENDTIFINSSLIEVKEKPKTKSKKHGSNKVHKIEVNSADSFLKSIHNKEPQFIKVNTEEDFNIILREGTEISIPKNAFVNEKTGKLVSGTIDLQISEFYKLSDMLLADLSTKSDDKILETGGMLYIQARKNGSKLKLKPQKAIKIVFNNRGKEHMQLFKGIRADDDSINWVLDDEVEAEYVIDELTGEIEAKENVIGFVDQGTNELTGEEVTIAYQFIERSPIYPGCSSGNKKDMNDCMNKAIRGFINKNFNLPTSVRLTPRNYKVQTSFEIDEKGHIGKISVKASRRELAEEISRLLELLPRLEPGYYKERPVTVKYSLPITYHVEGSENNNSALRERIGDRDSTVIIRRDKKFQKEVENKSISEISNSELERYTFNTTNLGWINCDRFVRSKKRKIKYKVKIKDSEGANVKMIFKSMSSVLPSYESGRQYDFGDVPVNEEVILLAIKKKGNKLYLGTKEVKTKAVSELDLEFKEVTIVELKTELYKLNKDF